MENKDETKKSEIALREEAVLEFWDKNNIFDKSLEQTKEGKEFVFFEGPPTANGKPGIHHLEARAFKDVIPRYKTMQGYHVRRKGGWDTHGLPVELQVEKSLNLNSKKAIEEYGVAKFNQACKENVWEYLDAWNKFTKRIGFWVDQKNPYITYHNDYIESVWNVVKEIDKQELLYKDYKVVPWCPRCGTALSSHELAQGYEDVKDLSLYVKFRLKAVPSGVEGKSPSTNSGRADTYLLAWTTTPWTLPGNVALAVGKDINYRYVKKGDEHYILALDRVEAVFGSEDDILLGKTVKGSELVGLEYEPLFPYFNETISENEKSKLEKVYKVYEADFVTTEDGTGVVHTAVMYGQDDFVLGTAVGLPKHHLVNLEGKFIKGTGFLEGRFVKEKSEDGKPTLDIDIIKYLTDKNLFFKKENYLHSYPHCWRCHTALIYYARDSWYIRMSDPKIKEQLIKENEDINWEPEHIRDGRFGEWLREIKDWAISRERYWGTPLPVWTCESCGITRAIGSIDELKRKTRKSSNRYFVVRHGEAESNVKQVWDSNGEPNNHLTEKGKQDLRENIKKYKNMDFDLIFASPMLRTRETAQILANALNFDEHQIIFDERLWEFKVGDFDGKNDIEYEKYIKIARDHFTTPVPNGESRLSMHKRMGEFLYELENNYLDKKILIISHCDPIQALFLTAQGYTRDKIREYEKNFQYFETGEIRELAFTPAPHNENYELDLHKPYIDEIDLLCTQSTGFGKICGGSLTRTKEVMDVWFDSGCMPFAQDHYPFEPASKRSLWPISKNVQQILYPADFISEAIDQTRGWFYTLHAIGILMGRGKAYKNVICLGHLLDANGKKMSKSLGNIVDPWIMIEKYGVDTLRLWMYSVNQPGESKNFEEKAMALLHQQVFGLLYNVLSFFNLYRGTNGNMNGKTDSKNILDVWIRSRLDELLKITTESLDNYRMLEPTRALRDFIGDLSTWYLRRSRERIKDGNKEAKNTLHFVLKNLAKIMAPFAPFAAEDLWLKLKEESDSESVHLAEWPKVCAVNNSVVLEMKIVREIVTMGLEARQKAGIKVRQPLAKLEIKNFDLGDEYIDLIKDELNVKEVTRNKKLEGEVNLDLEITPELKQEGQYREFSRALQDMRKKMDMKPNQEAEVVIETGEEGQKLVQVFEADLKKIVVLSKIEFGKNDGDTVKVDNLNFKIKIKI